MKAAILAAGEGRRLWPLTRRRPRPMLPVANRPLLEYVLKAVADAGIDEIVFVVGYRRERIQTYFGDGDDWGVDIEYVTQERQLGTGHAIAQLNGHVDGEFLVLNGDRLLEADLVKRVAATADTESAASLAVARVDTPERYGVVETASEAERTREASEADAETAESTDPRRRLRAIEEKPTGTPALDIINAGVYRLSPAIFEAIEDSPRPADGEVTLPNAITDLAADRTVDVVRHRGTWLDVSQLWDLLRVTDTVLSERDCPSVGEYHATASVAEGAYSLAGSRVGANATVSRGTAIGANVTVGPGAVLSNTVVFDDATIEPGAVLVDCIVGQNATVGANVTAGGGPGQVVVVGEFHEDAPLGGVIGDDARIDPGSVVEGRIDADATVVRG